MIRFWQSNNIFYDITDVPQGAPPKGALFFVAAKVVQRLIVKPDSRKRRLPEKVVITVWSGIIYYLNFSFLKQPLH